MAAQFDTKWIGWPGVDVCDEVAKRALSKSLAEMKCIPVFIEEVFDEYYNGFCNSILWPILHYLGLPQEDHHDANKTFETQYDAYKKANQMFLDVIIDNYEEGDIVWCHDYHLMFLPQYLKEYNNKIKVGWFLHSPFPSFEIFRTLPSRSELLRSVLTADLLGFQTYDFARNFVSTCTRILGVEEKHKGVVDQGRVTKVSVFPIGIDPDRFITTCKLPEVIQQMNELKEIFAGKKVILGVDRLDMIKGIPQKFLGFEKFLEENPSWRHKVVLVQIAVPTRNDIPEYRKLKNQVHGLVGRINGRFGSVSTLPIHHLDRSPDFNYLCALYAITDVMLVTSLRDGMNLVSYEFIACQKAKKGVLILSEFAGAGQSLGAGALLVNPWSVTEVSSAIKDALIMPAEERERRHIVNFQYVKTHSAKKWGNDFMSELNDTFSGSELKVKKIPHELPQQDVIQRYSQSNNRLIILGFCGTLSEPLNNQTEEVDLKLNPKLKATLKALCNYPKTTLVVLSRSGRNILDKNFGEYNLWLAAENGMFLRHTTGEWVKNMPEKINLNSIYGAKNVFKYFTERTPRSFLKASETSLVWNYEHADVKFGKAQARDLLQYLREGTISNRSVDVVRGNHSVEVHAMRETKGEAIGRILGDIVSQKSMTTPIDFVFCCGYFLEKDEDIYTFFESEILPSKLSSETRSKSPSSNHLSLKKKVVPLNVLDLKKENYFSATIGHGDTKAQYFIDSSHHVMDLLYKLAIADTTTTTMLDSFSGSELYQKSQCKREFEMQDIFCQKKEIGNWRH